MRHILPIIAATLFSLSACAAPPAATQPADGKLPHVQVDIKKKQVRVECESCNAHQDVGLEFFCASPGFEYESVVKTDAKASHVHLALLMIGLQPGEPVKWSDSAKKWLPARGPQLHITCEWKKDDRIIRVPSYRLMQNRKTKKEAPPLTWTFTGSRVMEDGKYAADALGYMVSVLNSELSTIDISDLVERDIDSREWDRNGDLLPPAGAPMWMVIEPVGKKDAAGDEGKPDATPKVESPQADKQPDDIGSTIVSIDTGGKIKLDGMNITLDRLPDALANRRLKSKVTLDIAPGAPSDKVKLLSDAVKAAAVVDPEPATPKANGTGISDVTIDQAKIEALKQRWQKAVAPHNTALREAAQAHYEVIEAMRREQQRLIDEADRIQRAIDELQKQYQEMTTPKLEPVTQ